MKKIIIITISFALLNSCSKDTSDACSWNSTILKNKTFKISKMLANGQDVTSTAMSSNPCIFMSVTYGENTYSISTSSQCPSGGAGTYSTYASGNQNHFVEAGTDYIISSYSCNHFSISQVSSGVNVEITMTKQ